MKLTELMFDEKQTPAIFFIRKAVCVLFANGKINGINLESSDKFTHLVPILDGYSLQSSSKR